MDFRYVAGNGFFRSMLVESPVHPLVFITSTLSLIMLAKLCLFSNCPKKTRLITIVTVISYLTICYFVATETPTGVIFDLNMMQCLTVLICIIAILPFFGEKRLIEFPENIAERDSIFFAASIMWGSPFISELAIWLRWYIEGIYWQRTSYMTLGGAETADILFRFGFWTLVFLTIFHIVIKLLRKKGIEL